MSGSVWNSNSWHWEERNYNKWAESYIKYNLSNLKIEKEDLTIYFDNLQVSGNACVSIRKGKQINSFEYVIKFEWLYSKKKEGKDYFGGSVEIPDFSTFSLEENDYAINIERTDESENLRFIYDSVLKKEGKEKIKECLKNFQEDLLKHDKNESNKELKIKEEEKTKLENIKICNEKKTEEENKSNQNINNNINDEKKEGSVWNINNYHWEEKCLTKWAIEELQNIFNKSIIELSNNIFLQFFSCDVEGEASSSLRKKKKILMYDLKITSEWKAYQKNKNQQIEIESKGHVSINDILSDFSSDDNTKYSYYFIFDNKTNEYNQINDVIKLEGPNKINQIIDDFILKMREK
ncbi:activator of Hsp90 ATPase [Plasmodium reichenowi]|uniref:Activator of Hsp90 ATPase n=1 Tax=Plasmodium reichenowi TaxID=5854 RepID=A0A151LTQ7_PLARE|nr:activator of Hsp90 ATPase, putative [Plasmodium reichenowi]KYO02556.1 activator of Hsp90 ATPase, putative [Plasmodium reichenowi]SOV75830.1 activator of Hsp90 ATPase [Plasmodium reichenowi]